MRRASIPVSPSPSESAYLKPSAVICFGSVPSTPYLFGLDNACIISTTSDISSCPSPLASPLTPGAILYVVILKSSGVPNAFVMVSFIASLTKINAHFSFSSGKYENETTPSESAVF